MLFTTAATAIYVRRSLLYYFLSIFFSLSLSSLFLSFSLFLFIFPTSNEPVEKPNDLFSFDPRLPFTERAIYVASNMCVAVTDIGRD